MGNKIVKLHGCSGAGKTTVARSILIGANEINEITPEGQKNPEAYVCHYPDYDVPIVVLGSYKNNCGGMDTIDSAAKAIEMVHAYHEIGHVFHEGLLQSTYYGVMGKDSEQFGDDYVYAFLNTPVIICLDRIVRRRELAGSKNKFDPQLTIDKFNTIERLKKKCEQNGRRVFTFDWEANALGQVHTILRSAA